MTETTPSFLNAVPLDALKAAESALIPLAALVRGPRQETLARVVEPLKLSIAPRWKALDSAGSELFSAKTISELTASILESVRLAIAEQEKPPSLPERVFQALAVRPGGLSLADLAWTLEEREETILGALASLESAGRVRSLEGKRFEVVQASVVPSAPPVSEETTASPEPTLAVAEEASSDGPRWSFTLPEAHENAWAPLVYKNRKDPAKGCALAKDADSRMTLAEAFRHNSLKEAFAAYWGLPSQVLLSRETLGSDFFQALSPAIRASGTLGRSIILKLIAAVCVDLWRGKGALAALSAKVALRHARDAGALDHDRFGFEQASVQGRFRDLRAGLVAVIRLGGFPQEAAEVETAELPTLASMAQDILRQEQPLTLDALKTRLDAALDRESLPLDEDSFRIVLWSLSSRGLTRMDRECLLWLNPDKDAEGFASIPAHELAAANQAISAWRNGPKEAPETVFSPESASSPQEAPKVDSEPFQAPSAASVAWPEGVEEVGPPWGPMTSPRLIQAWERAKALGLALCSEMDESALVWSLRDPQMPERNLPRWRSRPGQTLIEGLEQFVAELEERRRQSPQASAQEEAAILAAFKQPGLSVSESDIRAYLREGFGALQIRRVIEALKAKGAIEWAGCVTSAGNSESLWRLPFEETEEESQEQASAPFNKDAWTLGESPAGEDPIAWFRRSVQDALDACDKLTPDQIWVAIGLKRDPAEEGRGSDGFAGALWELGQMIREGVLEQVDANSSLLKLAAPKPEETQEPEKPKKDWFKGGAAEYTRYQAEADARHKVNVLAELKRRGVATEKEISEALSISFFGAERFLGELVAEGRAESFNNGLSFRVLPDAPPDPTPPAPERPKKTRKKREPATAAAPQEKPAPPDPSALAWWSIAPAFEKRLQIMAVSAGTALKLTSEIVSSAHERIIASGPSGEFVRGLALETLDAENFETFAAWLVWLCRRNEGKTKEARQLLEAKEDKEAPGAGEKLIKAMRAAESRQFSASATPNSNDSEKRDPEPKEAASSAPLSPVEEAEAPALGADEALYAKIDDKARDRAFFRSAVWRFFLDEKREALSPQDLLTALDADPFRAGALSELAYLAESGRLTRDDEGKLSLPPLALKFHAASDTFEALCRRMLSTKPWTIALTADEDGNATLEGGFDAWRVRFEAISADVAKAGTVRLGPTELEGLLLKPEERSNQHLVGIRGFGGGYARLVARTVNGASPKVAEAWEPFSEQATTLWPEHFRPTDIRDGWIPLGPESEIAKALAKVRVSKGATLAMVEFEPVGGGPLIRFRIPKTALEALKALLSTQPGKKLRNGWRPMRSIGAKRDGNNVVFEAAREDRGGFQFRVTNADIHDWPSGWDSPGLKKEGASAPEFEAVSPASPSHRIGVDAASGPSSVVFAVQDPKTGALEPIELSDKTLEQVAEDAAKEARDREKAEWARQVAEKCRQELQGFGGVQKVFGDHFAVEMTLCGRDAAGLVYLYKRHDWPARMRCAPLDIAEDASGRAEEFSRVIAVASRALGWLDAGALATAPSTAASELTSNGDATYFERRVGCWGSEAFNRFREQVREALCWHGPLTLDELIAAGKMPYHAMPAGMDSPDKIEARTALAQLDGESAVERLVREGFLECRLGLVYHFATASPNKEPRISLPDNATREDLLAYQAQCFERFASTVLRRVQRALPTGYIATLGATGERFALRVEFQEKPVAWLFKTPTTVAQVQADRSPEGSWQDAKDLASIFRALSLEAARADCHFQPANVPDAFPGGMMSVMSKVFSPTPAPEILTKPSAEVPAPQASPAPSTVAQFSQSEPSGDPLAANRLQEQATTQTPPVSESPIGPERLSDAAISLALAEQLISELSLDETPLPRARRASGPDKPKTV